MAKEKELIAKLQILKQIKPRKEWVVLAKMNMFQGAVKPTQRAVFSSVFSFIGQRKFAYSLVVLLLVFLGISGFLKYGLPQSTNNVNVAKNSATSLLAENSLKDKVEDLKVKSQNLVEVAKYTSEPQVISSALKEVKDAAKNVTETIQKTPELAKTVALEINNNQSLNQTILDIPGGNDLKVTSDDLYKAIDTQMIADLKGETLTQDQKDVLKNIEISYDKGDYTTALRDILLMNASIDSAATADSK